MRPLNSGDLARMLLPQEDSMIDVVDITNRTIYTDSFGDVTYSGVVQSGVACGFDFTGGIEVDKGQVIIVDYDADLRLPVGTQIGVNDTVLLVTLAGQTINEEFEVFGEPRYGTTVMHVPLKQRGN